MQKVTSVREYFIVTDFNQSMLKIFFILYPPDIQPLPMTKSILIHLVVSMTMDGSWNE
jgi:hypothetical protein